MLMFFFSYGQLVEKNFTGKYREIRDLTEKYPKLIPAGDSKFHRSVFEVNKDGNEEILKMFKSIRNEIRKEKR